jgi:hypothetical protein
VTRSPAATQVVLLEAATPAASEDRQRLQWQANEAAQDCNALRVQLAERDAAHR